MNIGRLLTILVGVVGALLVHAAILLFGGALFLRDDEDTSSRAQVELLTDTNLEKPKDEEEKPPEQPPEELHEEQPEMPDSSEEIKSLDVAPIVNDAPALAESSLAAIEQALNGAGGGGGDFALTMDFAGGGRIGGTGHAGEEDEQLDEAFSMNELDQKPRAVYQVAGSYPAEMRGKKVEGVVTVIFVVDPSGRVTDPRAEKSSHPAFEKPAIDAVKQWKFEAGLKGGQRVNCKMRVPIRFQPH